MNEKFRKMQQEEKANDIFKNRPPNMWNEPHSLEEKHEMRCSVNPFEIYRDDRVVRLYDHIKTLGEAIQTHQKEKWDFLVENVIQVYEYLKNYGYEDQLED